MITIGGNVSVRNGTQLDYCWKEAVESILPVCDSVVVCDGCSDDGTWEEIQAWAHRDPRIKPLQYAWPPASIATSDFWVDWLNYTREHVREDFHLQLDADEVLCPTAIPTLKHYKATLNKGDRISLHAERLNFWRDSRHLAPHGKLCGNRVIRFAPSDVWLPSDAPHPKADAAVGMVRDPDETIYIFHYGFLRKREAFFEKAARCRYYFCGTQFINREDPRISEVRGKAGNWMKEISGIEWSNQLLRCNRKHPKNMVPWLKERGYA